MKLQLKKSVLLVGAAVLLAGAVTLSVRHYQDYQAEQNAKRQVVVDQQAKAIAIHWSSLMITPSTEVRPAPAAENGGMVSCQPEAASLESPKAG